MSVADLPDPMTIDERPSLQPAEVDETADLSPAPLPTQDPLAGPAGSKRPRLVVPPRRREAEGPPAAPRAPLSAQVSPKGSYPLGSSIENPPTRSGPRPQGGVYLTPRMTAVFGGLFGLATVTSIIALLIQVVPPRDERALIAGAALAHHAGGLSETDAAKTPTIKRPKRELLPSPWRVSDLAKDPAVEVAQGTIGSKSFIDALADKGVPKAQAYRIMKAFEGERKFDKCGKKDKFVIAIDRATKRVKAFEYETSPTEIIQAREDENGILTGQKLDMKVAEGEVVGSFYVSKDLVASYQAGGLEDGIVATIDDALGGRISSEAFDEGSTIRVIAIEETALGAFSRYKRIIALEYRPADPAAKPIRIYNFTGQESRGYWDDRGKQPYSGGWRVPCPGAPVTSRFNPKRMHPVLHKIMPHNGTDFGAPMGTPVYSAYKGTIDWVGPAGPSGNLVTIMHPNGVQTGYAHLSRFAPGIKVGMKVGVHQLVGYVGSTGRSTGPHLHFSAKRDGKFFDAETLQMDGERVMPAMDRAAFAEVKAELDKRLDAIPLPEPPPEKPEKLAEAAPATSTSAAAGKPEPQPPPPPGAGIRPLELLDTGGDDDSDGIPIPAPLLGAMPAGPSSATPIASPVPGAKKQADPEPEDPNNPDEDEAH